jgi:hypothetical protein
LFGEAEHPAGQRDGDAVSSQFTGQMNTGQTNTNTHHPSRAAPRARPSTVNPWL